MGLLAMVGVVRPNRIYEGHHRPTDVAPSYLLGTAYVSELMTVCRRVTAHEQDAEW